MQVRLWLIASYLASHAAAAPYTAPVNQTTCNGKQYTYNNLAGYGYVASDARDKFGDTLGGLGSAIFIEKKSWTKTRNGTYTGQLWALPDRGWNTQGTLNFDPRVHKFDISLDPKPYASVQHPAQPNFRLTYRDTVKFSDPDGQPTTGLDANPTGPYLSFNQIPFSLPSATYTGDGFGGAGPGGERVSIDSEGLVVDETGHFWVSDEYGPFIYQFDPTGKMMSAIKPPDAIIPVRNGTTSYNSNTAPYYNQNFTVKPKDPDDGRSNNQGFEGLTISPDGKTLFVLLQSATIQDGGSKSANRRNSRLLKYDISTKPPKVLAEHVVQLPFTPDGSKVAAQSEIHYITDDQFLILARDSNAGAGLNNTQSVYRHADVFDISNATDVTGNETDSSGGKIADKNGLLQADITPAAYCSFLDYNVNSQLNRFGVRNGGVAQGTGVLNEKWESLSLVPVDGHRGKDGAYFLISLSDNDFITQNGYLNGGKFKYSDGSGNDLLNQALVFQVTLPV